MSDQQKCLIWGTPLWNTPVESTRENNAIIYKYNNPRAGGEYFISNTQHEINTLNRTTQYNDNQKVRLSAYIAKENSMGNIPDLSKIIKGDNWLDKLPPIPNPRERAYLLLEVLVKNTGIIGEKFYYNLFIDNLTLTTKMNNYTYYYPISYCSNMDEMRYLLNYLEECKFIKITNRDPNPYFEVTIKGFEKIKNISNIDSKTAFIAMWIDPSMDKLHLNIEKAIKQAGYDPLRIDKKEHNNKIDDQILVEINKSRFLVCDLTSEKNKPRGSVYFEAGYALGKNIHIIWTCKKELVKDIPFDIRQYNCLFWEQEKMNEFTKKLQARIENVIGEGPLKNKQ